ncbi:MAG TPA: hypothetical protein VFQ53_17735 [Kofleriaceae bacterium]|nr:hypothetical protein [Kofleriaceae bacterium]
MIRAALLAVVVTACSRPAPLASCDPDLSGSYDVDGKPWMVLDAGDTVEAYPLFADVPAAPGLEVAPRWIAMQRDARGIAGAVMRRYMHGSTSCVAHAPARITACHDDTIDIVLADPVAPLALAPTCTFPHRDVGRRESWHRVLTR